MFISSIYEFNDKVDTQVTNHVSDPSDFICPNQFSYKNLYSDFGIYYY